MLTSGQWTTCGTLPAGWSCEERFWDRITHTSLPVTVFIGWFDHRTSGDLRADTSSYADKTKHARLHGKKKKKKGKTLKRVVKQLTPFGATHTRRHDTSPLTVHRECAQAVHRTLPVTVSQAGKNSFWTQVHADTHTHSFSQLSKHSMHCLCRCLLLMKWSISATTVSLS